MQLRQSWAAGVPNSVAIARLVADQEVGGSNPSGRTTGTTVDDRGFSLSRFEEQRGTTFRHLCEPQQFGYTHWRRGVRAVDGADLENR